VRLCINFDTRLSLLLWFSFLVVRLTTINAISAFFYQQHIDKFDSETRWGLPDIHHVIVFVNDLRQVGGSLHKQMTITSCCSFRTFNLELWLHLWYRQTVLKLWWGNLPIAQLFFLPRLYPYPDSLLSLMESILKNDRNRLRLKIVLSRR
jgi:hypothetical protein